jgi:hypothetical protein
MYHNPKLPVLFLVMEFPPVNTTGNFRALKFVKYLHEFGIEPIVVTLKQEEAAEFFKAKIDDELMKEIPADTRVYRIHCDSAQKYYRNKFRSFITIYFSIKDNIAKRWRTHLMNALPSIIEKHKPKLIFTSLPPFSSGQLAAEISAKYNIPFVVDMRDFWAMWGSTPFPTKAHYILTLQEEKNIFLKATRVLGVTPQLVKQFQESHPAVEAEKFEFVPNGFDTDVEALKPFQFSPKEKLTIGYVGSFYYYPEGRKNVFKPWWKKRGHKVFQFTPLKEDWLYRSPYFFFRAIQQLLVKHPGLQNRIELHFVGNKPSWFDSMAREFSLQDIIVSHGFVTNSRAREVQKTFDLILATSEKVLGGEHYCLPSKVFDYVGINRPILGFVTPGIQRDFIVKSGLGVICDPDDERQALLALEELILVGRKFCPNVDYLSSYHRRNIALNLASIFKTV